MQIFTLFSLIFHLQIMNRKSLRGVGYHQLTDCARGGIYCLVDESEVVND